MFDYIKDVFDEFLEKFHRRSETPAANHLFYEDKESEKMNKEDGSLFNHMVAKLLYLYKRASPDIQTDVSFLCTQVWEPYIDDWKKLQQTIRNIEATRWLPLMLEADGTIIITWWVYASYRVHDDFRGYM